MITKHYLEQISVSDDEAKITNLLKNDFDIVTEGELIIEFETSKASIEICANSAGIIKNTVSLNENVKVGSLVAIIGQTKDEITKELQLISSEKEDITPEIKNVSAKALKMAAALNIEKDELQNLGLFSADDVKKYAEDLKKSNLNINTSSLAAFDQKDVTKEKLAEIKNLSMALSRTLQCRCAIVIENFNIDEFSKKNNLYFKNIFPIIALICSKELISFQNLNGFFLDNKKNFYKDVNIGFTIGNDDYLQVPVIHNCSSYDKEEIQKKYIDLVKASVQENITLSQIMNPTFVISDLSAIGDCFYHNPLLAPFTSSILGLAIDKRSSRLVMTLTYDHQMSSGKEALTFLEKVRNNFTEFM